MQDTECCLKRCTDGTVKHLQACNGKFEYYFFYHMEDFGSDDKSEIDILVRQGDILYPIEVKAFTDANKTGVKECTTI